MILSNLAKAVRDQNYYAVVLEFLIVISGVVIGFQIQAWNEDRQARQAEHESLVRLQAESEVILTYWTDEVANNRSLNQSRRLALEALSAGVLPDDQVDQFDRGIFTMGFYPSFNPPSDVYNELIASGGLSKISDLQAREAMAEYVKDLNFITGQLDQFRPAARQLDEAEEGLIYAEYDPDAFTLLRTTYDFEELAGSREFISAMVGGARNQVVFFRYRMSALGSALNLCLEVSRAVGMVCEGVERAQCQLQTTIWSPLPEDCILPETDR